MIKKFKIFENFEFDEEDFDFEEEEYGNKTFTVRELIDRLENIIPMGIKMKYLNKSVRIEVYSENGKYRSISTISSLQSWRGSYYELTLDSGGGRRFLDLNELIGILKNCPNRTFTGYKGGRFKMDMNTPVWADPYGRYRGIMIVDVIDKPDYILLKTKKHDDSYE